MKAAPINRTKSLSAPLATGVLLQRKCACGGSPGADRECEECRKKKLSIGQKLTISSAPPTNGKAEPPGSSPLGHSFGNIDTETADEDVEPSDLDLGEPTGDQEADSPSGQEDAGSHSGEGVDDPKPKPAKIRGKVLRGSFPGGGLISLLGGTRGKYLRHRHLDFFRKRRPRKGPEERSETQQVVVEKKIVTVKAKTERDSGDSFNTQDITAHGNAFYRKGEKKTGTVHREREVSLFGDDPVVTSPRGGKLMDQETSSTVTGTLTYSFGDLGDTLAVGGKGRILITRESPEGVKTVYDSRMITTLGKPVTIYAAQLKNLAGNAVYKIEITRETWWAGETEYMFDLKLHQTVETTAEYEVEVKKKVKVPSGGTK